LQETRFLNPLANLNLLGKPSKGGLSQPKNRVSAIILGINAEIFARNPVSKSTG